MGNRMEHNWVPSSSFASFPTNAVAGGYDCDGAPIYVGRAMHNGENLPAKVIPKKGGAFVAWDGAEHSKFSYDILVGLGYNWKSCYGGNIPQNAVSSGTTRNGEPLYVGRGHHSNSLTVGKIHPSHGCLYIPFGFKEIRVNSYDVLVYEPRESYIASAPNYTEQVRRSIGHNTSQSTSPIGWNTQTAASTVSNIPDHTWMHSSSYSTFPPNAVVGGQDCDGAPIYVGRALHEGENLPAKVIPRKGGAFVAWNGAEHSKFNYEVLVGQGYNWVPCNSGSVPSNAVLSGKTRLGEPLYVGRGRYSNSLTVGKIHPSHGCLYIPFGGKEVRINPYEVLVYQRRDVWVVSSPNYTPPGAVVAGHDSDHATIYVGRALHDGEMLPAKIIPSKRAAYICRHGHETNKHNFEILTGHGYFWVKAHYHAIPPNAVSTGISRNGEQLFIGRGHHHGSLTPGQISVSQRCLYIPYGGHEIRIDDCEVLCRQ